jgi:FSR family fosmidomycin resistance protein-like MFS transporter
VRLLVLLTLAHLVVDAYATTVPALLPFWQARFALSYGLAGLITGIANVTSSVAQPLVGIVTDRGRDTRWIAFTCLLAAAGISATGLAPSYTLFLALVVVGGLGVSGFHPQGYKLTGLYAGRNQAAATSWFLVGGNVGVALGPLLGTELAVRFGPAGTAGLFLPGALFAAAMWFLVPRWTARSTRDVLASRAAAARAAGHAAAGVAPAAVAGMSSGRRKGAIAVLVGVVALRSTVSNSLNSFIPLYYVRVAHASPELGSQVLAGMLLSGALATLAGGYLADRLGRLRVLAVTLAAVPPLVMLFLASPPGSVRAVAALWGAGAMVTASFAITVVLAQDLWYERRALASGIIVGFAFGMGGLFVPVIGAAADALGLAGALRLLAGVPIVALALVGLLAALMRDRPDRPDQPAIAPAVEPAVQLGDQPKV